MMEGDQQAERIAWTLPPKNHSAISIGTHEEPVWIFIRHDQPESSTALAAEAVKHL